MGLFDEITFEAGFKQLPEGLPRTGWQTKDLNSAMCHFMVEADGLFVRRRYQFGGGSPLLEVNPQLNAKAVIYDSNHALLLIIQNGYAIDVKQDWDEEPSLDEGWIPWKP